MLSYVGYDFRIWVRRLNGTGSATFVALPQTSGKWPRDIPTKRYRAARSSPTRRAQEILNSPNKPGFATLGRLAGGAST